ncbi:hypothetical protein MZO42_06000 [Sphingomonas psychrotolerans]|uniref:Nucleoside 2-deoxyribosyltransferase n=1 Tax=Sphingomonas psychrotolerans TaxID=1327635 RepID=A0ABU3N2Z6_9SPHN|nr:hypothetical protein [Sphingomonas psychrotolerans]MDT8758244.1 hypothetical protein [Sphingomonas psychrotolerans]
MAYFNVIIGFFDGSGTSQVPTGRFLGLRGDVEKFRGQSPAEGNLKAKCLSIPAVFTEEISLASVPIARIGWITGIVANGRTYRVTYDLPAGLPLIRADRLAEALGLTNTPRTVGEMQHSKWQLLEGDLFKTLFEAGLLGSAAPTVFAPVREPMNPQLVSAMMPFSREYDAVYETIVAAVQGAGGECKRADNVWEHSTIIQDIYSLIYKSAVVVCDFSGKNPNVFYEAGIAHSLGRPVIPIVQHAADIPFDLQQHRTIIYHSNSEGLEGLKARLSQRIATLLQS